jgi:hypothetical protein
MKQARVKNFNVKVLPRAEEFDIELTFKFGNAQQAVVLPRAFAIMLQADLQRVLGLEK